VAQTCFVRVHQHLHRLEPQARFSTLLFGIARNLALNHLRDSGRRGRGQTQPLDAAPDPRADPQSGPAHQARMREIEAAIADGIAQLSPEHREVLLLREMQGMDYDAIARVLGCRVGTVKSRIARAREQLRQRLEAMGGEWL
jgi:RNA polymerase sigma-70 factor (ECF subfamily)